MNKIDIKVTACVDMPSVDMEHNQITLTTQVADEVTRRVMRMEDEALRAALIEMGWTPPEEKEV